MQAYCKPGQKPMANKAIDLLGELTNIFLYGHVVKLPYKSYVYAYRLV